VGMEELGQLINPLISSEIKPAIFQFVYRLLLLLLLLYYFGENFIARLHILSVLSDASVESAMLLLLTVTK
jgi:hypothetical protein